MNIATMTPEEKNLRIALLCGWTVSEQGWWSHPTLPDQGGAEPEPPNYGDSRDACAQFEAMLTDEQWESYADYLLWKDGTDSHSNYTAFRAGCSATAAQRCDAFLEVTSHEA